MDFNRYYQDQASGVSYPVYKGGVGFQKGYGLGGLFRQFFSWVVPILKQHALPAAKNIGKEVVKNVADIATEVIEGKDLSQVLSQKRAQAGNGYKRKRNLKKPSIKKKKRRLFDIFDKNVKIHK